MPYGRDGQAHCVERIAGSVYGIDCSALRQAQCKQAQNDRGQRSAAWVKLKNKKKEEFPFSVILRRMKWQDEKRLSLFYYFIIIEVDI